MTFPNFRQSGQMDCGVTCLYIISTYYNKGITLHQLSNFSKITKKGASLKDVSIAAKKIGFHSKGVKINYKKLSKEAPLPCIVHWRHNHFIVVYKVKNNMIYASDPALGLTKFNKLEFIKYWIGNDANENSEEGIALLLEPIVE